MGNLDLWSSIEKTDPAYTKKFQRGGGFSGTATNATYLARKATERFGPMGTGWGIGVVDEQYVEGAPYLNDQGVVIARETIHKVRARLWYVLDGVRGEVEQFGQTVFLGRNKNGYVTDEEHAKKSLTDAMSKCLSLLGFSADIHLGRYDDNKYVAELKREFAEKPASQSIDDGDADDEGDVAFESACNAIGSAPDAAELARRWTGIEKYFAADTKTLAALKKVADGQRARWAQAPQGEPA